MKSAIERRMEIANLVGVRGKVSVGDLAEYFGVSGATIRTDLRFLESMGHIVRSNGYVILNKGVIANFSAEPRSRKEKYAQDRSEGNYHSPRDRRCVRRRPRAAASGSRRYRCYRRRCCACCVGGCRH